MSAIAASSLLSAVPLVATAVRTWRRREMPGAATFVLTTAGAALWAVSYGVALFVFDPGVRWAVEPVVWLAGGVMPVGWFVFALQYTGRADLLSRRRVLALAAPAVAFVALVAVPATRPLLLAGYEVEPMAGAATVEYDLTAVAWTYVVYSYLVLGTGLVAVGELLVSRAAYRRRAVVLMLVVVLPSAANLSYYLGVGPLPRVDLTPILFSLAAAIYGYGLFRQDILDLSPATRRIGREVALDGVGDPVFIVEDGLVVDANEAAGEVAGGDPSDSFGRQLERLLGVSPDGVDPQDAVLVETPEGRREFDVTTAPIEGADGRRIGQTVVLHDVSDRVRRQQRIEVLNRTLRHNIRNDAGTILGLAELLRTEDREESVEFAREPAAVIAETASDLVDVAQKARDVDRLLSDDASVEPVAVREVVEAAIDDVASDDLEVATEAELDRLVDVDVNPDLTVRTRRPGLRLVVKSLVENAVEHGRESPRANGGEVAAARGATASGTAPVSVTARVVDDGGRAVEVVVADDGPGVPEAELAALEAGSETALRHGSGLGLWVIDWGTRAVGGTVTFDTDDGTTATVRVPDRADDQP